ncbi:MAG TPA: transcription termination factor Rho [Opitutaceae bacterium]|nr:transcription termination factor Rho [Opitutaceae bacterium]
METPTKNDADDALPVAGSEPESGEAKKTPRRRTRYYKAKSAEEPAPAGSAVASVAQAPAAVPPPAPAEPAPPEKPAAAPVPAGSSAAPAAPAAPSETEGGGPEPEGGFQERGFWKRNKRKRGKHGWQPGGGKGGNHHPAQPPPPNFVPVYGDLPDPARFADAAALDKLAGEISSGKGKPLYLDELYALPLAELTAFAREQGVTLEAAPNRKQLLTQIFAHAAEAKREICDRGWLDLTDRGHGFVVHEQVQYRLYHENSYVPESLVRRYGLKRGHRLEVLVQAPQGNERCPAVVRIDRVMDGKPEEIARVTPFEELVPYYPLKRILLEAPEVHKDVSMRVVDMLTPIGFGQRGLIVAPPRTGKTVLLQNIANSISHNSPKTKLILLLIDERPEEVTDFRRHTKGEVVSSTFDEPPENHVHAAEMVGEKSRRLVEAGQHVVILLDSITRLARAYNALAANSGKIMSGGIEATALQKPKRFFGAARNIEGGGSLTIIGTALIDTGSRMDEVIFEEFKGTGNMELHLDRGLVDKRIFPAINMDRSGTRKEELIYHPDEMQRVYSLRRAMQGIPPIEAMEMLISRLKKTRTNAEFLMTVNR